ncbi:hypothetical protein [Arthrobacter pityocampae]|nr:hypothetical protein [Arthrobacter pityocampae]
MSAWIVILLMTALLFSRTAKRGLGIRWPIYMGPWGAVRVVEVNLSGSAFEGDVRFTALVAGLLTVSTTTCAWFEA